MGEFSQRRLIRKLDLERFLAAVEPQPLPQAHLEQYTSSPAVAAELLHLAAYTQNDIVGKSVLDLGCGTGRLALGAAFLGANSVVGVDVDRLAIKTAQKNAQQADLADKAQWGLADVTAVTGRLDTGVMNPPFGVQNREADRAFLDKSLEVASNIYSLHSHPEVDERLIRQLKSCGVVQVAASAFLERFIERRGGRVVAVYAVLMTIPKMFEFHNKAKHDFVIDLYVIKKRCS
jgi:putative methylase